MFGLYNKIYEPESENEKPVDKYVSNRKFEFYFIT
jgi:hypothetical protein